MTYTKTTSKILGTSIVAFAVLALIAPANMAHATLVGDDVTIVLDGADTNNNPDAPAVTDTVLDSAIESNFYWGDVGCGGDDGVQVDIENETIEVSWGGGFGNVVICDAESTRIDQPLIFTVSSLDWVGNPNGIVTGVSETYNSGTFTTSATVLDDHSVEVTVDIGDSDFGSVVFTLQKSIEVDVDIKPGSDPNSINTNSMGVVPVAILGSDAFDVTTIDVTTLMFGAASPVHDGHYEDVNEDTYLDLVTHYKQKETEIACGDTTALITGALNDASAFVGEDSVNPVPCKP